ncbi:MAG: PEP-CTERM sorting domain-containing protein [Gemmatimonadales bacterium]
MKKFAGLALGVAALMAPVAARADVTETRCAGSTGAGTLTCVTAKFALSGGNLQVYLFNGSTAGSKTVMSTIVSFGIFGLNSYNGTWGFGSANWQNFGAGTPASGDVSADWSGITSIPGLPGVTFNQGADAGGNGGLTTCAGPTGGSGTNYKTCDGSPGPTFSGNQDWMLFTFTHVGGTALDAAALTALEWGWKAQRVGANSISIECRTDVGAGNAKFCGTDDGTGGNQGEDDVVPEPGTMSLLAMGLAGMAANRRRRRNK